MNRSRVVNRVQDAKGQVSGFFITINSNRTDMTYAYVLEDMWHYIYNHMYDFIGYNDPTRNGPEYILDIAEVEFGLERGDAYGRIHAHCLFYIRHRSNIRVDKDKVRDYAQSRIPGCYTHIDFRDIGAMERTVNYIRKNRLIIPPQSNDHPSHRE